MVSIRVSDITNPPPVPCSVLDPSVKQQMSMGTCFYDVRVESVFVVLCE